MPERAEYYCNKHGTDHDYREEGCISDQCGTLNSMTDLKLLINREVHKIDLFKG